MRVEFLFKTDSGYPKDAGVNKSWDLSRQFKEHAVMIGQVVVSAPSDSIGCSIGGGGGGGGGSGGRGRVKLVVSEEGWYGEYMQGDSTIL